MVCGTSLSLQERKGSAIGCHTVTQAQGLLDLVYLEAQECPYIVGERNPEVHIT